MATWVFGDSCDCYAAPGDAVLGYWDSGTTTSFALKTGRFAGSQCLSSNLAGSTVWLAKSSGANDPIHHIVCAFRQTATLTGTALGIYFQLSDGATNQCCVVFRSDGAILLTSATPAGTVLATYTGAVSAQNTWFGFEFEVVISGTVGRFRARKNGNTSDDFDSGASLNTKPGANAYANKLTVGQQQVSTPLNAVDAQQLDDLLWRSDPTSVPFVGDVRAYVRMPASHASVVWSRSTGATNFSCVDEAQQNAATDYVFSANLNDVDFYGIAALAASPATTVAVTTRGLLQKSDAGTRGAQVQLKSGGTTVGSTPTLLPTTWQWLYRTDLTDPATGSAWTNTGVSNVQIGPKVTT